jgi:glutathione S-transferase
MLQLYYNPLSPNARRVWLTLLEKDIPFEETILKLDGDQLTAEFSQINPFHHIPVLVDGDLKIIESLAIMDYLEQKYPTPALLPQKAEDLAIVRMTQLVVANELMPPTAMWICEEENSPDRKKYSEKITNVLHFVTELIADRVYFGGDNLTLGDIVAGNVISLLPRFGFSLAPFPQLEAWEKRLWEREVWQKTKLSDRDLDNFRRRLRVLIRMKRKA